MNWVINIVILCVLALVVLNLLLVLKLNHMISKLPSYCGRREKNTFSNNDGIKQSNHSFKEEEIHDIVEQAMKKTQELRNDDLREFKGEIIDELKSIMNLLSDYRNEAISSQLIRSSKQENPVKFLYASAANENTGEFYNVTEKADKDSIFELKLKEDYTTADFRVYQGAHKIIVDTPDYLLGSCKTHCLGRSVVITKEYGEAALVDGKWKVIKQANVILE